MTSPQDSGSDRAADESHEQGFFQCSLCKKTYNRADHLIRHVRTHTQEKPYVCQICSKGFTRPDLLRRHAVGHENDDDSEDGAQKSRKRKPIPASALSPDRVSQACKACSQSKSKCSDTRPCDRCLKRNLDCEPLPGKQRGPRGWEERVIDFSLDASLPGLLSHTSSTSAAHTPNAKRTPSDLSLGQQSGRRPTPVSSSSGGILAQDLQDFHGYPQQAILEFDAAAGMEGEGQYGFFPYNTPEQGEFGSSTDIWDSDGLQDAFQLPSQSTFVPYQNTWNSMASARLAGVGVDAFRRSAIGAWSPSLEDSGTTKRQDVIVPKNVDDLVSFEKDPKKLPEALTLSSRDKIVGLVLESGPQSTLHRITESFPSAEFLTNCIQYYFSRHEDQIDSYIHLPTLKPNEVRPELLTMLAGAGAVCTASAVVRKLGYALHEAAGLALKHRCEENRAELRELPMMQTAWLYNEIGLWSNSRRRIEVSESLTQLFATVLRRAGMFKRYPYQTVDLNESDMGKVLEDKWRKWAHQESMKRVQYHAFVHDSRVSVALHVSPVISYPELELPFPSTKDMWAAPNATLWKVAVLARMLHVQSRVVSLNDALQDMSSITSCRLQVDIHYSALILLHGLWSLVWEYKQLNSIGGQKSKYWNALVLSSRHQELCLALQQYRLESRSWETLCPRVLIVLELISLHLHMSLEELQLYAGKEDVEEAKIAYQAARQWFRSPASRRAVWHAGQLLRAARWFMEGTLFDFFIIAVYHASMAFWSFSTIGRSEGMPESPLLGGPHAQQGPHIVIDQPETLDLTAWVDLSIGVPVLSARDGSFVPLDNTAAVMELVADLLISNWKDSSQPALLESVHQLVRDLGTASRSK